MTRLSISLAALVLAAGTALAQQKGGEEKSGPQMQGGPAAQQPSQKNETQMKSQGSAEKSAEPKDKATKGTAEKAEPSGKGSAQKSAEPKDKGTKGTAEKTEPTGKGTKGSAEKAEPKDKGTAQRPSEPKDGTGKGTAEKSEPSGKSTTEKGREPSQGTKGAQKGTSERTQVTEQQRTNITQTLTNERQLNRVSKVNFSLNIGTRVPRSVHLVALPASVVAIVPGFRSYQYFVADERVCIVDPRTYEIVEVIEISSSRTAGTPSTTIARLILTEEEKEIILSEVDLRSGSTLGLGALTEGAEMPRRAELRELPDVVVQKVPKVREFRYVAAEGRVALVDPQSYKVAVVIEQRR